MNKAGTVFATCGDEGNIHLYNAFNYQLIKSINTKNAVKNIAFLNTQDKIIFADSLGTFEIHDIFDDS